MSQILKQVCYVSKKVEKVKDLSGKDINVYSTFPYNPESKTSFETAQHWANNSYRYEELNSTQQIPVITTDNNPFSIQIIDLEVRGEGGRAYKVIDEENRMFDLREDQLVEAINMHGIAAGGKILGKFIWGVLGSQVRIILENGELHKEILKEQEKTEKLNKLKLIPAKLLKIGGLYKKLDKHESKYAENSYLMFLGKVNVNNEKTYFAFITLYDRPSYEFANDFEKVKTKFDEMNKKWPDMTWAEKCKYNWKDISLSQDAIYNTISGYYNYTAPIEFMLSIPKLIKECGYEPDFAETIKENTDNDHEYLYYGGSLVEKYFGVIHSNNYWNLGQTRQKEEIDFRKDSIFKFKNMIKWI